MTVRLLVPFNGLPAGSSITGADEAYLIEARMATGIGGGYPPPNPTVSVTPSQAGVIYTLRRTIGQNSAFALRGGSDANLSIVNGNQISATAGLAAGVSQVALIRETAGSGNDSKASEYTINLMGALASGGGIPVPALKMVREDGDSRTAVPAGTLAATGINYRNNNARNVAAGLGGQVYDRDPNSIGWGGTTWRQHLDGTAPVVGTLASRMAASATIVWRLPLGINDCVQVGATSAGILADVREACNVARANGKVIVIGFWGGSTTGSASLTAPQLQIAFDVNQGMNSLAAEFSDCVAYVDVYGTCQPNPAVAGDVKAGLTYDGRHALGNYGFLAGPVENAKYQSIFGNPATPIFDVAGSGSILPNPNYAGGTGATLPTGCTHSVPAGLGAPTYTSSNVGGVDQLRIQLSGTPSANGQYFLDQAILAAAITAGMTLRWGIEVIIAQGSFGFADVAPTLNITDGVTNQNYVDLGSAGAVIGGINNVLDNSFASAPVTLYMLTGKTNVLLAGASYTTRRARFGCTVINAVPMSLDVVIRRTRLANSVL